MADNKSVISPIPGVFYRRPSPDQDVFVREGQKVKADDTIGLIEVMKNFYEIQAGVDGLVERFIVESEDIVDAGQEIAVIRGE
ncbi:acetyl-CoA carboxylase [Aneurinibacillus sp. Ricciae_BoGa-3]|uniref:acetyl-CoA carboxylase n=1 Tax=Aneurinibacillus sp. Ricciae_BoGa-3 TaxID=3022697 RepID=UPI00233F9CD4|nr:acetyl-CoA carboxylase [Aneurinibacillus sp. Ricciae_BoGa-3]WCK53421.1 acetyl-CoA carboxylase [Aneurinibacillus sp. Ricciae_BoGa-3]